MQHPFPIFLDLTGRPCVVFGAGPLATEKVESLVRAGAVVRRVLANPRPDDLDGAFLAVAALDNAAQRALLFEAAEQRGVLFNALDDPPHCRFYFPAVHRQGALVVALSTSGQCPALAVRLKEKLAELIGPEYSAFLRLAASIRDRIQRSGLSFEARRTLWYRIVDAPAIEQLRSGDDAGAEQTIAAILQAELPSREPAAEGAAR